MVTRGAYGSLLVVLVALASLLAPVARAQPAQPEEVRIEEAKRLFRQGVDLFSAGDRERALELFLASRAAFPSVQNTSNVAICLDELGRYDEALEVYEQLLVEFKDKLGEDDRAALGPSMKALRGKVGSVFVSANVNGKVVIDGRARAELPLTVPIRVLPGERHIRVIRTGYVTWEVRREIALGKTVKIDAELEPLAEAGLLRVEDAKIDDAQVFVDGAPMGQTPWEGTLGPGPHLVWTQRGDMGSLPRTVVVVQGQTAVIQLESQPLGPEMSVRVDPPSAELVLGDTKLGKGRWTGRLPVGNYELVANEEGYFEKTQPLRVEAGTTSRELRLALEVDEEHPRWPKGPGGEAFVQAFGGFAFSPGLGADAEGNCVTCPDDVAALGLMVGARGGYRFPFGFALELGGGYLRLGSGFDRIAQLDDQPGVQYPITDDLLVHGAVAALGVSYRYRPIEMLGVTARVSAGAFFESAADDIAVSATKGGETATLVVQDLEPVARGVSVFTQGEIALELLFGNFGVGVAMGIVLVPIDGPAFDDRTTSIGLDCDPTLPDGLGCIRSGAPVPDERAHQLFFAGLPQVQVGYAF